MKKTHKNVFIEKKTQFKLFLFLCTFILVSKNFFIFHKTPNIHKFVVYLYGVLIIFTTPNSHTRILNNQISRNWWLKIFKLYISKAIIYNKAMNITTSKLYFSLFTKIIKKQFKLKKKLNLFFFKFKLKKWSKFFKKLKPFLKIKKVRKLLFIKSKNSFFDVLYTTNTLDFFFSRFFFLHFLKIPLNLKV